MRRVAQNQPGGGDLAHFHLSCRSVWKPKVSEGSHKPAENSVFDPEPDEQVVLQISTSDQYDTGDEADDEDIHDRDDMGTTFGVSDSESEAKENIKEDWDTESDSLSVVSEANSKQETDHGNYEKDDPRKKPENAASSYMMYSLYSSRANARYYESSEHNEKSNQNMMKWIKRGKNGQLPYHWKVCVKVVVGEILKDMYQLDPDRYEFNEQNFLDALDFEDPKSVIDNVQSLRMIQEKMYLWYTWAAYMNSEDCDPEDVLWWTYLHVNDYLRIPVFQKHADFCSLVDEITSMVNNLPMKSKNSWTLYRDMAQVVAETYPPCVQEDMSGKEGTLIECIETMIKRVKGRTGIDITEKKDYLEKNLPYWFHEMKAILT